MARRGLPKIGEQVWCSAPQKEEHLAVVSKYRNNFTEVLVNWNCDTGRNWKDSTWLHINFVRTIKWTDTHNLRDIRRINYSE